MDNPTLKQLQWMENVQRIYVEGEDDKLYKMLRPIIERQARISSRRWKWAQVDYADFCSFYWEMTWNMVVRPYIPSKYLFYQTWRLALHRMTISIVRQATQRKQSEFNNNVLRIGSEITELSVENLENDITDKLYVEWLLKQLNDEDKYIVQSVLDNPDTSMNGIATITGHGSGKTVLRKLRNIAGVVTLYG